jgi:hypothetical protein
MYVCMWLGEGLYQDDRVTQQRPGYYNRVRRRVNPTQLRSTGLRLSP